MNRWFVVLAVIASGLGYWLDAGWIVLLGSAWIANALVLGASNRLLPSALGRERMKAGISTAAVTVIGGALMLF